jgi:hypothetical protein
MHRSFAWGMIAILAIMLAPFAGVFGVPAGTAHADTAAPTAAADDEIIVITSGGQLRVDDPYTPPGYKPVSWNSGTEVGWTVVAAGDFNGDGDAELVAARGSFVKVFDPVVQPGQAPVEFSVDLGSSRNVRLLNTGDFDGDGKDEFAVMHYIPGTGMQAGLVWYDGGTNASQGQWTKKNSTEYGAMFLDMATGDFNNDGADDLAMVRNVDTQRLVSAWNVKTWSTIAEGSYSRPWIAVAGGNLSSSHSGDEISLTRDSGNAVLEGLILFKVVSGAFADLATNSAWKWDPDFASISDGDLNGDGDDEVVMLRAPNYATTSLLMVNPAGASMNSFEQSTGYGSASFKIVRTGDTDGDGKDEIVILKGDRYRIYTEPNVGSQATETMGSFYTPLNSSPWVSNLPYMALANVDGPGISAGPTLGVSPTSLSFSLDCGNASPLKPLSITNTGTASNFAWQAQAIEDNGSGWLLLDTTSGTTPGTVNVSVKPGVAKGSYTGKVRITATDSTVQSSPVDVPVSYTALCSGFSVSPTTLDFNLPWGSTVSKSVTVGGPGPTAWTATVAPVAPTTSCSWMTPSALAGTTPSTVDVLVNAAVADLSFKRCTIIFSASSPGVPNSPQYVTVNLTVPDPGFVVTPTDITIWQKTSVAPVIRSVTIFRPGGTVDWAASALPLSAAAGLAEKIANGQVTITAEGVTVDGAPVAAPDWLVFTPTSGTTNPTVPTTMQVSVKPATPVGTYRAVITVASSGDPTVTNPVQQVYVTAVVADNFHFNFLPLVIK